MIASIDGGGVRNAIPREASVVVVLEDDDIDLFVSEVALFEEVVQAEYKGVEESIAVTLTEVDMPVYIIEEDISSCIVWAVAAVFDGVANFSNSMKGLVQSSSNLARVVSEDGIIKVQALIRSASYTQKQALVEQLTSTFELADADVTISGGYDGWIPNMESPILKRMQASYSELFGVEPRIKGVHAGLECGVIASKYPHLDMISLGPTIKYPHSPDERVEIASVEKFYKLLLHTIENVPAK